VTWELETQLPHRSIKERLERIRLLNGVGEEGREWYRIYLSRSTFCDLSLLLSLPICKECAAKYGQTVRFKEFHLDPEIRKKGLEDAHAQFRTDFSMTCIFCGRQRLTDGFVRGIPDVPVMCDMTVAIVEDQEVNLIRRLQQILNHLSENYVHFSTTVHPDKKPDPVEIGGRAALIWGFEGLTETLKLCSALLEKYFIRMRGQFGSAD